MTLGERLVHEKFIVIITLGFSVFVLSWLYGLRDFENPFYARGNYCTEVWAPKGYGRLTGQVVSAAKWTRECALAAEAKRGDIIFAGSLTFAVLTVGFLLLCWRTQD